MVLELQFGWCGLGLERGLFPRLRLIAVSFALPSKPLLLRMEDYERHLRVAHDALRIMKRQLDHAHKVNAQIEMSYVFPAPLRDANGRFRKYNRGAEA